MSCALRENRPDLLRDILLRALQQGVQPRSVGHRLTVHAQYVPYSNRLLQCWQVDPRELGIEHALPVASDVVSFEAPRRLHVVLDGDDRNERAIVVGHVLPRPREHRFRVIARRAREDDGRREHAGEEAQCSAHRG